jgi:uncharacterized repeat protein (TIGR01451 family)
VGGVADVALTKAVSNTSPTVGANVTFTVTASNLGPIDATGVVIGDALPAGLTLVSASASAGSYAGGVWTLGSLSAGAAATLTLVATVNTAGTFTNTATRTSSGPFDPNPVNDTASVSLTASTVPGLPNTGRAGPPGWPLVLSLLLVPVLWLRPVRAAARRRRSRSPRPGPRTPPS